MDAEKKDNERALPLILQEPSERKKLPAPLRKHLLAIKEEMAVPFAFFLTALSELHTVEKNTESTVVDVFRAWTKLNQRAAELGLLFEDLVQQAYDEEYGGKS